MIINVSTCTDINNIFNKNPIYENKYISIVNKVT